MSEYQNPHTMVIADHRYSVTCAAEGCSFRMSHYDYPERTREQNEAMAAGLFNMYHRAQYDPGRAPDIAVQWEISACCSVCEDGIGDIQQEDGETLSCKDCGTTWHIDGTNGEKEENND